MELFMLGAGMGVVGGLLPSPLHFLALAQVGLGRWRRAVFILCGPPLLVDGALLLVTFFFYDFILQRIAHDPGRLAHNVSYVGGAVTILFGVYSLIESRRKKREELARSVELTYGGASVWVMAWGTGLHREFKSRLFMIANVLLVLWGIFYILRAYFAH